MRTNTGTVVLALFAAPALMTAAGAVSAGTDPIVECRAAHGGDSAAHIACLEEALRVLMPAAPAVTATPVPAPTAVAATPVPASAAVATTAAATAAVAPAQAPAGLGAEQVKARERPLDAPPETAEVRIVSSGYNSEGLGIFRMADGQVWRETTPAPQRHKLKPGQEYAARIETSKLGGYRLYVDGKTWMYKVERLK